MIRSIAFAALAALNFGIASAQADEPRVTSQPIPNGRPASELAAGQVEVTEVFWLGCPHCLALESFVQSWMKDKADYIVFNRVHAAWRPELVAHARLYYALHALGRADLDAAALKVVNAFDTTTNKFTNRLYVPGNEAETLRIQLEFAEAHGIKKADFLNAYNSRAVLAKIEESKRLTAQWQVIAVPRIIINGKYQAFLTVYGGEPELFPLVDKIAAEEHAQSAGGLRSAGSGKAAP